MRTPFAREEYEDRWRRVHEDMCRCGHAAALVIGRGGGSYDRSGDVLYLANHYSPASGHEVDNPLNTARSFSALLLEEGREPQLLIDDPEPRRDRLATGNVSGHNDPMSAAGRALAERTIDGTIALVGADFLPLKYWRLVRSAAGNVAWTEDDTLIQRARRIKSPAEMDVFREAGEIATRSLDLLMTGLVGGMSEAEAVGEAIRELRRSGAVSQMIPVAHGPHIRHWTSEPLTGASRDVPRPGDLVRGWLDSIVYQGYWLDPGRTAVAGGRPTDEQRSLIENCVTIVDSLIEAIRPGVLVHDVARLGDRLTARHHQGSSQMSAQWPLYGHGTGLYWEHPYIGLKMCEAHERFEAGMVLGVEVFLDSEGTGTAAHEQNIIVHAGGNEVLTHSPDFWW